MSESIEYQPRPLKFEGDPSPLPSLPAVFA